MKGFSPRTFRAVHPAILLSFGLFAAGLMSVRATSVSDRFRQAPPDGMLCVIADEPANPIDPIPFTRSYIKGIAYQIRWNEIEPTPGCPNWAKLDELFDKARMSHKWIQLLVFPGFFSPAWAYQGAQTDQFKIQYGPDHGTVATLPMPWDPVYLRNWYEFVRLLSERYACRPELRMIAAAGPTSVSDEFTLPDQHMSVTNRWITDGYTPAKYIAAWKEAFDQFSRAFPHQYISLSHGNGLPINDLHEYDPSETLRTTYAVEDAGYCLLGKRLAFQSSALRGTPAYLESDAFHQVMSYVGKSQTGFQEGQTCEKSFKKMGGSNPTEAMQNTVDNAESENSAGHHVNFLEVHNTDVDAQELQTILEAAGRFFDPPRP